MVFSDYCVSPNFLVVLGLRLWLRLGLGCDNSLDPSHLDEQLFFYVLDAILS